LFCFCNDPPTTLQREGTLPAQAQGPVAENYRLFIVEFEAADKTGFGRPRER
jgi:hypothetical protein